MAVELKNEAPQQNNQQEWTLGKGRLVRGVFDVLNGPLLTEAKHQDPKIDQFLQSEGYKEFIKTHPNLAFSNLYKNPEIAGILAKNSIGNSKADDAAMEKVADAAAIMFARRININIQIYNEKHPNDQIKLLAIPDATTLRGTAGNHWKGTLEKFLKSEDAVKAGVVNVKGECRGQVIQELSLIKTEFPKKEQPPITTVEKKISQLEKTHETYDEVEKIRAELKMGMTPQAIIEVLKKINMDHVDFPKLKEVLIPILIPILGLEGANQCIKICWPNRT